MDTIKMSDLLVAEAIADNRCSLAASILTGIIIRDGVPCNPEAQARCAYDYADWLLKIRDEAIPSE